MEELGLPDSIKPLTQYQNGIVLVTGSVGSGKSTTLASLINHINEERTDHIITLEDPIEYIYSNQKTVMLTNVRFIRTRSLLLPHLEDHFERILMS